MDITCYLYQIPFKPPFRAGDNIYEYREGIILEIKKNGITAYGEAAPLPGFSGYSLNELVAQLREFQSEIKKLLQSKNVRNNAIYFYKGHQIKPSLCFALDTLILDFLSQQQEQSLANFLFEDHVESININGVIGSSTQEEMLAKSESLINEGFNTLKFKVGPNADELVSVLTQIREKNSNIVFRIDANQSWSLKEAEDNLAKLEGLDIEYCEEPLKEISVQKIAQLQQSTLIPIALDETINKTEKPESYLPYISFIILKPMVMGAILKLFATKALADTHDTTTVFTSSLESGIGRMMTATLASGLGAKQTAHGLATGSLLTMDVWDDGTYISNGRFTLPDNIGLGKGDKSNPENIATQKFKL